MNTFVDCCLLDRGQFGSRQQYSVFVAKGTIRLLIAVPSTLQDGLEAAKIAIALTHSFRSGQPVAFDDQGEAILE